MLICWVSAGVNMLSARTMNVPLKNRMKASMREDVFCMVWF